MLPAFGILNVNKTPGLSSRDVVTQVAQCLDGVKAGHAGTLDPMATGVLVVCLGPATRLIPYLHQLPKSYVGNIRFGLTSDSDDIWGNVRPCPCSGQPDRSDVQRQLGSMLGTISQVPPAISAIRIRGRRAYEMARRGETVDLQPRQVQIHSLEIIQYRFPELVLQIGCGSGMYVRSLARDLGLRLQCPAVLTALHRVCVGPFHADHAIDADRLGAVALPRQILPPIRAVAHLAACHLDNYRIEQIANGVPIELEQPSSEPADLAGLDCHGRLIAVLSPMSDGRYKPKINFLPLLRQHQADPGSAQV